MGQSAGSPTNWLSVLEFNEDTPPDPSHSRHFPYHQRPLPPHFGQIIIVPSMDISSMGNCKVVS